MKPTSTVIHLWLPQKGYAKVGEARAYGACGTSVGRFSPRIEEVNCSACIEANDKENDK